MAMDKGKRKSNRSFDLEKGAKRTFDLQKTSARKFDLSKEADEVSLEELKADLLADGKLDADEVIKLREVLYADGKIDQKEADFLFELNDAVSGKNNDPTWEQFFVEAISDYLLKDEQSPGEIDEDEGKWLVEKIGADGKVDGVEKQLLTNLKQKAKKMPAAVAALLPVESRTKTSGTRAQKSKPASGTQPQKNKAASGTQPQANSAPAEPDASGSKKWLWIILAIVAVAAVAYFGMKSCSGSDDEQTVEQLVEESAGENEKQTPVSDSTEVSPVGDVSSDIKAETPDAGTTAEDSPLTATEQAVSQQSAPSQTAASQVTDSQTADSQTTPTQSVSSAKQAVGPQSQVSPEGSVEELARGVIRGLYGNGTERKQKLGDAYRKVQDYVNDMYRKGLVN